MSISILAVEEYVPSLIPLLFLFVFLVASTTVGYLLWRSSRGPSSS